MAKPVVISFSSHVARGSVGNRAMVFALERLGFTVWAAPTIVLPHHPGHGPAERIVPDDSQFAALLQTLLEDSRGHAVAGIISGYFATPGQARAAARLVQGVRKEQPHAVYLCDPVVGDGEQFYVGPDLAAAIRDALLPLADVATPNAFETRWLAAAPDAGEPDLGLLAGRLPPPTVLVTSAPALMRGHVGNLLVQPEAVHLIEHPAVPSAAKGTGDLVAALLLARRLQGHDWEKAAQLAISSVFEIIAGTAKDGADELLLAALQHALVQPRAPVNIRRIAARAPAPCG